MIGRNYMYVNLSRVNLLVLTEKLLKSQIRRPANGRAAVARAAPLWYLTAP